MIQNPNYKGKWKPPLIDNPEYDVSFNSCGCLIMPLVKVFRPPLFSIKSTSAHLDL